MNLIGTSQVVRPYAYMKKSGGSKIDITSVSVTNTAGALTVASVGVVPGFFDQLDTNDQSDDMYEIYAGDRTDGKEAKIFSGYIISAQPVINAGDLSFAVSLIHDMRDLDQASLLSPSFHPQGVFDYSHVFRINSDQLLSGTGDGLFGGVPWVTLEKDQPVAEQILREMIVQIKYLVSFQKPGLDFRMDEQNLKKSIAAIERLLKGKIMGKMTLPGDASIYAGVISTNINQSISNAFNGSMRSYMSGWSLISSILNYFNIRILCLPTGVAICPDVTNITPPESNVITSKQIRSLPQSIGMSRKLSKCLVVTNNSIASRQDVDIGRQAVGVFPGEGDQTEIGATFVATAPSWLGMITLERGAASPEGASSSGGGDTGQKVNLMTTLTEKPGQYEKTKEKKIESSKKNAESAQSIMDEYAKLQYYYQRNRTRHFNVVTALAPGVFPGTTAMIDVDLHVKPTRDGQPSATKKKYYGYCSQVQHIIDAGAGVCRTGFTFQNITDDANSLLKKVPFFPDTEPLKWA